jgi:hypothetical protein
MAPSGLTSHRRRAGKTGKEPTQNGRGNGTMTTDSAWSRPDGAAAAASETRLPSVLERRLMAGESAYRFAEVVKLNGLGTRVIDRNQERRLLEEGIGRFGLTLDEARGTLHTVAADNNYVFESQIAQRVAQILARDAGKKGRISKRQFNNASETLRDFSDETISGAEAKRRVKRIMVENDWKPRPAGPFRSKRWFKQVVV